MRKRGEFAVRVFVTLLRDGVHLILANPPWRQLQERAQKIQGDKKHDARDALTESLRRAVQYRT
jgi:methylase of polypeptide subunit release factors